MAKKTDNPSNNDPPSSNPPNNDHEVLIVPISQLIYDGGELEIREESKLPPAGEELESWKSAFKEWGAHESAIRLRPATNKDGSPKLLANNPKKPLFEVVDGRQRVRAAVAVGHKDMLAIVSQLGTNEALLLSGTLNLKRKDMNPIERAHLFVRLHNTGMKKVEIARRIGLSPGIVGETMKILDLDPEIQSAVASGDLALRDAIPISKDVEAGKITADEAKARAAARVSGKKATKGRGKNTVTPEDGAAPVRKMLPSRSDLELLLAKHPDFDKRLVEKDPDLYSKGFKVGQIDLLSEILSGKIVRLVEPIKATEREATRRATKLARHDKTKAGAKDKKRAVKKFNREQREGKKRHRTVRVGEVTATVA